MGVQGLWRLIESSGKPVPLETLENKVLAIDISIWLHQAVKGFKDAKGAAIPNAHLLGIYHRLCKLLYYRIRPVFVFDGGVPALKLQTIAKRNQTKSKNLNDANVLQKQLLNSLLKHAAISAVLSDKAKAALEKDVQKATSNTPSQDDDIFELQPSQVELMSTDDDDIEDISSQDDSEEHLHWDLHTVDEKSAEFKSLPLNVRHEILTDLKETRKQSSWGRIHELPTQSDDFSGYQMKRLLKRHSVQVTLEEVEKEMGGCTLSLEELENLLTNHGVIDSASIATRRIASDENKRFVYIKNLKEAIQKATNERNKSSDEVEIVENCNKITEMLENGDSSVEIVAESNGAIEYEKDLENAIKLSLEQEKRESANTVSVQGENGEHNNDLKRTESKADVEVEDVLKEPAQRALTEEKSGKDECKDVEECEINMEKGSSAVELETLSTTEYAKDLETAIKLSLVQEKVKSVPLITVECQNGEKTCTKTDLKQTKSKSDEENEDVLEENLQKVSTEKKTPTDESKDIKKCENNIKPSTSKADEEFEKDLENAIRLSLQSEPSTSKESISISSSQLCENIDFGEGESYFSDSSEDTADADLPHKILAVARNYMIEYSGLTPLEIGQIIGRNHALPRKGSGRNSKTSKTQNQPIDLKKPLNGSRNPIGETPVELISDSDSGDEFEEVETTSNDGNSKELSHPKQPALEITVEKVSKLEDDLFGDIFKGGEVKIPTTVDKTAESPTVQEKDVIERVADEISDDASNDLNMEDDGSKESELLRDILRPSSKNDEHKLEMTSAELRQIRNDLVDQTKQLETERSTKERLASNITEQMCLEAQELLQLFGVPYIIAPMEAEAQCAFLNQIDLTDGTITDDSDIWLFGGKTVYKNFFNQSKHVMEFKADAIQQSYKLSRNEMILLALLVGSDYTSGIRGIGPVTALEILAAFPPPKDDDTINHIRLLSGLTEFRKWLKHTSAIGAKSPIAALKRKLKNIEITEPFPSVQVVQAYLDPAVETSRERFSWQRPDKDGLIEFARQKFGWKQTKSEKILEPVLRRMEDSAVQTKITNFFKVKHKIERNPAIEDKMSKRVKKAVDKLGNNDDTNADGSSDGTKKKRGGKTSNKRGKSKKEASEDPAVDADVEILNKTKKLSRNKIREMKIAMNEMLLRAESSANGQSQDVKVSDRLHRKEKIPQKERDKAELLKNKLRAVEVFRKSQHGPGYVKKRNKTARKPKQDAELSESSD